jgi:hypothetical protein
MNASIEDKTNRCLHVVQFVGGGVGVSVEARITISFPEPTTFSTMSGQHPCFRRDGFGPAH